VVPLVWRPDHADGKQELVVFENADEEKAFGKALLADHTLAVPHHGKPEMHSQPNFAYNTNVWDPFARIVS
jgi:hypothetical protein